MSRLAPPETSSTPRRAARAARSPGWRAWLLVAGLVALVAAALTLLPLREWLGALVGWVHALGVAGVVLYALVYVVAIVFAVPGSILTMGAGFAWGPLWGFLLVSPVSVVGATLAFLLGRTAFRARVERRVAESPRLQAVDRAVEEQGGMLVFLLRLSPVMPFNFLNYAVGLTRIRTSRFALASWLGMMPGTLLYAYLGSTLPALGAGAAPGSDADTAKHVLFWGGLVTTLVATVFVTRIAHRALSGRMELPVDEPSV
ncbi:MAG: TVP38/TMEM64 family protein [Deltaproteobacteria bacterium]|nr:MAG: TVP38/TMEM64 family protein [Deltaproteobacteria bacterium]